MSEGAVRLETSETKNSEARTVYMDEELKKLLKIQNLRRKDGCEYVFHRDDQKIKDIRGGWNKACRAIGLGYGYRLNEKYAEKWEKEGFAPGPIFHDLRRTAVRNMVRSGITEGVAMMISGHKTRTVFERYNIVSPDDLKAAALKHHAFRQEKDATTAKTATIEDETAKTGNVTDLERLK